MANWEELVTYVKSNYHVSSEDSGVLKLIFGIDEGRSQLVLLSREVLGNNDEEWVQILSPFGQVGNISLQRALETAGQVVCGGAAIIGNTVFLKHATPLADMSVDEFERPFRLVITTADRMEREIFGGDQY